MKLPTRPFLLLVIASAGICAFDAWASDDAWRAEQSVEEAWIRDQHEILLREAPAALNAAQLQLALSLAELQRKTVKNRAAEGWQREVRTLDEKIRQFTDALRRHPQNPILQRARARLWKTPQYHEAYRLYVVRLQEVRRCYEPAAAGSR